MGVRDFYRNHPNLTSLVVASIFGGTMYAISHKLGEYQPFLQSVSPVIGAQLAKIPIHMITKNRALRFILPPILDGLSIYGFGAENSQYFSSQNLFYDIGPLQLSSQAVKGGIATFFVSTFKKSVEGISGRGLVGRLLYRGKK